MRNIILGTDWCEDCDDAVAIRLLARHHKSGKINLLGVNIDAQDENSVKALDAFIRLNGLENIPIGIDKNDNLHFGKCRYHKRLLGYPSSYSSNSEAYDGVKLYRKLLAESSDSVDILEIGFQTVLCELLKSKSDEFSPLDGVSLVREKVGKVWLMAGRWDIDGREYNICATKYSKYSAAYFIKNCPVPITFLGFEVGADVVTGQTLREDDVLHGILEDFGCPDGRFSWDPMLCQLAVTGDEEKACYDTVSGVASVSILTGKNHFRKSADGKHKYVVKIHDNDYYKDIINSVIE